MVAFIIFGTRGITWTADRGQFHCPRCGAGCDYVHKTVRRFFTLYFIPCIPLDKLGEYVECGRCQGTYQVEVLNYNPAEGERQFEAMFMIAMKQVMIAMLLADGVIDDNEVIELQNIFEELAGVEVTEEDLREEIAVIQQQGSNAIELISRMSGGLNDNGKEKVIAAAYRIAVADGHFDDTEKALMKQLADAMDVTPAHFRGIISELAQPAIRN